MLTQLERMLRLDVTGVDTVMSITGADTVMSINARYIDNVTYTFVLCILLA